MTEWQGYVALNYDRGIKFVEFNRDVFEGKVYINIWVDDSLADDVESLKDFESNYGTRLYDSLEGYKVDDWIPVSRIWKELLVG